MVFLERYPRFADRAREERPIEQRPGEERPVDAAAGE
jgi:hypothetical protein